ncbi:hypothetical protein [Actinotalea sp. C106]|uniref:hypothetical protein n=1 Tax=Actinotalea sp. C106 TaxID=2908644 RepID=UPI0020295D1B|nr:hypothetical protein [Actinotalea sp. C106]
MGARGVRITALGGALLLLAACAPGANELVGTAVPGEADPAGFLLGLWHGFIAPIAFVVSLFAEDVGIYEAHNVGGWYDLAYLIGLSAFVGGGGGASQASRGSRRRRV